MERYETPLNVATLLARWAPRKLDNLLEPAVGNGALLVPMIPLIKRSGCKVVCVDIDGEALARFARGIGKDIAPSIRSINGDFLGIHRDGIVQGNDGGFDCVMMNPPFSGRIKKRVADCCAGEFRYMPLEAAFVVKSVQLLRSGGIMLAVLPSSIISSLQGRLVREYLLRNGCIQYVHELPRNTFVSIETKSYVVVFRKNLKSCSITLCNHSLEYPERLVLEACRLGDGQRLDFSHQKARLQFERIVNGSEEAQWRVLGDLAEVVRGMAASPDGVNEAIHTTDFRDGFWNTSRIINFSGVNSARSVTSADLLAMRVGRNCYRSLGIICEKGSFQITDCVLRIRPKAGIERNRLLFSLRCALNWNIGRDLIQRGNGASYIIPDDLMSLRVPFGASLIYPRMFSLYDAAIKRRHGCALSVIERCVQERLLRRACFS